MLVPFHDLPCPSMLTFDALRHATWQDVVLRMLKEYNALLYFGRTGMQRARSWRGISLGHSFGHRLKAKANANADNDGGAAAAAALAACGEDSVLPAAAEPSCSRPTGPVGSTCFQTIWMGVRRTQGVLRRVSADSLELPKVVQ